MSNPPLNPAMNVLIGNATLFESMGRDIIGRLHGQEEEIEQARKACREGNPFPLVALQWPRLVLDDPTEIQLFQKTMQPERFENLPEQVQQVCLDPSNPPLRIDWWQKIIIAAFFDASVGEIYIKGCTGAGKGAAVGMAINLWFDTYEESRSTLTSETFQHALKNIFGEVKQWRRKMMYPGPGNLLTESLSDTERHYVDVRNPVGTQGEAFSGAHGENTLYVFDEATASPDTLFDNAEKNARKIVALANPRTMLGRFRNAFAPLGEDIDKIGVCYGNIGLRLCVTVGGPDCINVAEGRLRKGVSPRGGITLNGKEYEQGTTLLPHVHKPVKALIPRQIDLDLFRNNCAKADPREVDIYAYGKFPDEDPQKQVILMSWLVRHQVAWRELQGKIPVTCFGLDVARSLKGDRTVLASGSEIGMKQLHEWRIPNIVDIATKVVQTIQDQYDIDLMTGRNPICIDYGGGYGSGVGDLLEKQGIWVIEFQPSSTSTVSPRNYGNLRAESYAMLGRRLDPDGAFKEPWALPTHKSLAAELTAPEKKFNPDGIRFILESKEDIKVKLRNANIDTGDGTTSPDCGDVATYLFHAVRIMHDLDQYFMRYDRDFVLWPPGDPEDSRTEARRDENDSQNSGFNVEDLFGDNPSRDAFSPPAVAEPEESDIPFVQWVNDEYGH